MQNIKTIIFDLGGVIINLKTEYDWIQEDLIPNFKPEELETLFQHHFFQEFEKGKITVSDFIHQLKNIAIEPNIAEYEIVQHWNAILLDIPKHRVDLLNELSKKYKLILLSNTNDIHMDFIRKYMLHEFGEDILDKYFHTCYCSQEIGMRKPDKEIYEFVLNDLKINATETLFLDDKPENLIEAEKLGIITMTVKFNNLSINNLEYLL